MVVKQVHVLEPQDLLITRADKGEPRAQNIPESAPPPRGAVPRLPFIHSSFQQLLQLIFHAPLSYIISAISRCEVEYMLTASTSAGTVDTLISACDLRKLTYREPIPVEGVRVCQRVCLSQWTERVESFLKEQMPRDTR